MTRRLKLSDIAVTMEERQTYVSQAATAEATYQSALANLEQARINFKRTQVRSPVNGYVTNLTAQLGDYANVGDLQLSVVNSNSYWVDAYFEETALDRIHEGDAATIKLMGYSPLLRGRVQGLARGINVPNATPDASGLASVNPIFTFVRLAQRVPVRIHIDEVPEGVELVAGLTATVQVEPYKAPPVSGSRPSSAHVSKAAPQSAPLETPVDVSPQSAPPQAAPSQAPCCDDAAGASLASRQSIGVASGSTAGRRARRLNRKASHNRRRPRRALTNWRCPPRPHPRRLPQPHAASADLKTLEEQIAANPPSGAASSPTAGNRGNGANADAMGPGGYLGQTVDLYDGQTIIPAPAHRSLDSLHRRARPRWRHGYGHQ